MKKTVYQHSLPLLAASLLAACSSQTETPVEPINADSSAAAPRCPAAAASDSEDKVLPITRSSSPPKPRSNRAMPARPPIPRPAQPSAMANSLRNQWLKQLGRNGQWQEFVRQYGYLKPADRDKETRCYAALAGQENQNATQEVLAELGRQPEGCNRLLDQLAAQGRLPADAAWRRVRGLLANNQISDAPPPGRCLRLAPARAPHQRHARQPRRP